MAAPKPSPKFQKAAHNVPKSLNFIHVNDVHSHMEPAKIHGAWCHKIKNKITGEIERLDGDCYGGWGRSKCEAVLLLLARWWRISGADMTCSQSRTKCRRT